ncbi:radical SAM protein [Candidatus Woesearchaeota archaeon]|nr:radical SAM protein [Candidatus Woesearchaeota archaeon]
MIPKIVKTEKDKDKFILFNRRGTVLELDKEEYVKFRKHCNDKSFPEEDADFWNKLCNYDMAEFQGYIPKKARIGYSQDLLSHDSEEPVYAAPIVVHLGITSACNMRCKYCSVRQTYQDIKELSTAEWKMIIRKLARLGAFQIGLTGGEPTLRKDVVELAQYITKQRCAFNLTTNAWNLNEGLVKDLAKAGMKQCQLSLDSHLPAVNDLLRQEGCASRVEKAISILQEHGVAVGIDCVVSKNNISSIPAFVKWLGEKKVPYLTLIKVKQGDLPLEMFRSLLPGYQDYSKLINDLCERRNENPCVTVDCGSVSNLQYALQEDELDQVPVAGCPVGHTLLSIAPNGDIYPCVALSAPEFRIGNALTDNLEDLWKNSQVLKDLRRLKSRIKGKCQTCDRFDRCRGGCRGITYSLQSLWESEEECRYQEVKA